MTKPTLRRWFNLAAKLLVAILLAWALWRQVFASENLGNLRQSFLLHFHFPNLAWLAAALALVPLNLGLEALKFKLLVRGFSKKSFGQLFQSVLAGTTLAIFTPNRVGEYAGRALFVEPEHGWKAVVATGVGSLSQFLGLLAAGLAGALWFSEKFLEPESWVLPVAGCLGALLAAVLLFAFFNIDLLVPVARRVPLPERFKKHLAHLDFLKSYTSAELALALGLSFLRYLTYSAQYFLLLRFFGIPAGLGDGAAGIATIFLVQASIPLPPVLGLLARGQVALFVWGFFSEDGAGILAASFGLFIINLAAPSLIGLAFIVRTNIAKSLGYES